MGRFYVYAITVDGTCRYIGKGTGGRLDSYMLDVRRVVRARAAGETVKTRLVVNRLAKAWTAGANIEATSSCPRRFSAP